MIRSSSVPNAIATKVPTDHYGGRPYGQRPYGIRPYGRRAGFPPIEPTPSGSRPGSKRS